jgi:hypothetical protein
MERVTPTLRCQNMKSFRLQFYCSAILVLGLPFALPSPAADFHGWTTESPREEIRPWFSSDGPGSLVITHDEREGLDGWFQRSFAVEGGKFYRFEVRRKV